MKLHEDVDYLKKFSIKFYDNIALQKSYNTSIFKIFEQKTEWMCNYREKH